MQRGDCGGDHLVIDTDCTNGKTLHAERGEDVGACGLAGFGAEAGDTAGGVVTGKCGEVDTAYSFAEPSGLMVLLDRTTPRQGRDTAFYGGCVGLRTAHPVEIERHTGIARLERLGELIGRIGERRRGHGTPCSDRR